MLSAVFFALFLTSTPETRLKVGVGPRLPMSPAAKAAFDEFETQYRTEQQDASGAEFSQALVVRAKNADKARKLTQRLAPLDDRSDEFSKQNNIWGFISEMDADNAEFLSSGSGFREVFRHPEATAYDAAWLIVQHSPDLALQEKVLAILTSQGRLQGKPGRYFATLYDRVQLLKGGKQRYGTQLVCHAGNYVPISVESPEKLYELRMSIGFSTSELEYIKSLNNGRC